jgi:MPBQ/MSBQ methyltransferase
VDDVSWNVAPSVAHVPWTSLKFLAKVLMRGELGTLHRERRNNVIAPLLGMVLGMSRPHFSYCIVSGRKPEEKEA